MMFTYRKLGKNGRFGNQLFQIASTIGIAKSNGFSYGFPEWEYQKYFVNELPKVKNTVHSLEGYLQDYKFFEKYEHDIRSQFEMKFDPIPLLGFVFVHFRAYSDEKVEYYHPEQNKNYYENAMSLFPGKTFIVFTDNITKAKKVMPTGVLYNQQTEMEAFHMMTQCDGAIISNSTFSWWAAWLQNKKTVMPKNWFTQEAINKNPIVYNSKGLYLPNWIAL